jgi:hypothetical protein
LVGPSLLSNFDTAPVSFSLRTLGRCLLVTMLDFVTEEGLCGDVRLPVGVAVVAKVPLSKQMVKHYMGTCLHAKGWVLMVAASPERNMTL